jgi:hypothetical protein
MSTYKEKPDARDHAADVVLSHESNQITILSVADKIPEMSESVQEIAHGRMIVGLAVVGR